MPIACPLDIKWCPLTDCVFTFTAIATRLSKDVCSTSFFLFGTADEPRHRGLVQRRKEVGWFAGKQGYRYEDLKQDIGASPCARYGMAGKEFQQIVAPVFDGFRIGLFKEGIQIQQSDRPIET